MFKSKHTNLKFFAAGILCCAVLTGIVNSVKAAREETPEPVPQDMNDRIIAATFKCVQAGMEPEIKHQDSSFPNKDTYFVVCAPPGGKESNLDRLMREGYGPGVTEKFTPPKKQTPPNPDSFETKSKVTQ